MLVKKRNGTEEVFSAEKINITVSRACENLGNVSVSEIIKDAEIQLTDGIKTTDIDQALLMSARSKIYKEPQYSYATARLLLQQIYKEVGDTFSKNIDYMVSEGLLDRQLLEYDLKELEDYLVSERDLKFQYLGLQTLYDRYFIKGRVSRKILETPQAFFMRVAMGLALAENKDERMEYAKKFYDNLSNFNSLSSTPTLFNSGTTNPQLSSCFLSTVDDSIDGIFDSLWQNARKSKYAGGLGFDITPLRAKGSYIAGTNGDTSGCVSFLKLYNDMLVAVNQGGKRRGSGCAYMEPWHLDIYDFLALRKNTGDDRLRTHDMNTAVWLPDYFMQCVKNDSDWYLFSPNDCPELHETYGKKFVEVYTDKVLEATTTGDINYKVVRAKELWKEILKSLYETGHPWITFKDPSNERYPLKDVGVVHSSNLCTEILEHNVPSKYINGHKVEVGETAVCNLASINLAEHFLDVEGQWLDERKLKETIRTTIRMLDNVISLNYYPTDEARNSSYKHRFIGLGSMGWQDMYYYMGIDYDSEEAKRITAIVQNAISNYAIEASSDLAMERGSFKTFEESTWAKGELPVDSCKNPPPSSIPASLRAKVKSGMRNACVMAIAPTATISYIAGCSQSIEPNFSVLYVYSTLSGNFMMINKWFVDDMKLLGLWDKDTADLIRSVNGELDKLPDEIVPEEIKYKYRTAFDLDQHKLIDVAAVRQAYIDQGQSLNLYNKETSLKELNDLYFHAWESGLKTTYYLRNRSASDVEQSSVAKDIEALIEDRKARQFISEIVCHGCE